MRLIKWANNWDIICFEVSNIHIFHGLFGIYLCLFMIKTENDKAPRPTWIKIPNNPTIEQLLESVYTSLIFKFKVQFMSDDKGDNSVYYLIEYIDNVYSTSIIPYLAKPSKTIIVLYIKSMF